jgi:hypothetical protein
MCTFIQLSAAIQQMRNIGIQIPDGGDYLCPEGWPLWAECEGHVREVIEEQLDNEISTWRFDMQDCLFGHKHRIEELTLKHFVKRLVIGRDRQLPQNDAHFRLAAGFSGKLKVREVAKNRCRHQGNLPDDWEG